MTAVRFEPALLPVLLGWAASMAVACGAARGDFVRPGPSRSIEAGSGDRERRRDGTLEGRWLVHAVVPRRPDASGAYPARNTATWIGANRIGRSIALGPSTSVHWSSSGRWLALCDPRGGRIVGFVGSAVSKPIPLGPCREFEWAPRGDSALIRTGTEWQIVEVSPSPFTRHTLGVRLAGPVLWSPSGRHLVAVAGEAPDRLQLVTIRSQGTTVNPLRIAGVFPRRCRWASRSDRLVCEVERDRRRSLMIVDPVSNASADPTFSVSNASVELTLQSASALRWLDWPTDDSLAFELGNGEGLFVWAQGSDRITRLFSERPIGERGRFALSPKGRWLADCTSGHVRLWDLASPSRTIMVPKPSGDLIGPRWSPDGTKLLVSVSNPRYPSRQGDVWLVGGPLEAPTARRILEVPPDSVSSAWFTPGSRWVIAHVRLYTPEPWINPAASSAAPPQPGTSLVIHVQTGLRRSIRGQVVEWAPDDRAVVTLERSSGSLGVRSVVGSVISAPRTLRSISDGVPRVRWQPGQ